MSVEEEAIVKDVQQGTVRPHQPGQDVFRSVLSEEIEWTASEARRISFEERPPCHEGEATHSRSTMARLVHTPMLK